MCIHLIFMHCSHDVKIVFSLLLAETSVGQPGSFGHFIHSWRGQGQGRWQEGRVAVLICLVVAAFLLLAFLSLVTLVGYDVPNVHKFGVGGDPLQPTSNSCSMLSDLWDVSFPFSFFAEVLHVSVVAQSAIKWPLKDAELRVRQGSIDVDLNQICMSHWFAFFPTRYYSLSDLDKVLILVLADIQGQSGFFQCQSALVHHKRGNRCDFCSV